MAQSSNARAILSARSLQLGGRCKNEEKNCEPANIGMVGKPYTILVPTYW